MGPSNILVLCAKLFCVCVCLRVCRVFRLNRHHIFSVQLMISSFKRLLYFSPFLFILFFNIFVNFTPSLPLHTSICQQTIPRRFRPVLSLLFHFQIPFCFISFQNFLGFCFLLFFPVWLEGLVFLVLLMLVVVA